MNGVSAETATPSVEWWGRVEYQAALDRMTQAHEDRVTGAIGDKFYYLEHEPVITYGRATDAADLHKVPHEIPVQEVSRGGLATYHGPGQLVGYIVMSLAERAGGQKPDIHAYLRALETGLINFLGEEFKLKAGLREGFTGVWTVPDTGAPVGRKLASIGVSARKWVTSHGFALNIQPDMSGFRSIVPCGITDAEMTSVQLELDRAGIKLESTPMETLAANAHKHIVASLRAAGWLL